MDERTIRFLFDSGQRMLLFDCGQQLSEWASPVEPTTEVEIIQCAVDASWEADVVLINVPAADLEEICIKIKPYVTQKTVIALVKDSKKELIQNWLPDTEIITVSAPEELEGLLQEFMAQF